MGAMSPEQQPRHVIDKNKLRQSSDPSYGKTFYILKMCRLSELYCS